MLLYFVILKVLKLPSNGLLLLELFSVHLKYAIASLLLVPQEFVQFLVDHPVIGIWDHEVFPFGRPIGRREGLPCGTVGHHGNVKRAHASISGLHQGLVRVEAGGTHGTRNGAHPVCLDVESLLPFAGGQLA